MTDPGKEEEWIDLDHKYWTEYLAQNPGFIKKEAWANPENPGEIHTFIWWNSMDKWKQISEDEVIKNDEKFISALNGQKSEYTDLSDTDVHKQLYSVKEVLK